MQHPFLASRPVLRLLPLVVVVAALSASGCRSWRTPHDATVRVAAGREYFVGFYSRKTFTMDMPMPMPMPGMGGGSGAMMTAQLDAWLLGKLRALGPTPDGLQAFSYTVDRLRLQMSGPMMGMVVDSTEAAAAQARRAAEPRAQPAPAAPRDEEPVVLEGTYEHEEEGPGGRRGGRRGGGMMMGGGMMQGMMERMMPGFDEEMATARQDLDRALAMLRGFTITFRVAPDGRIVSVDNPVTLMTRMAEAAGSVDPEQAEQLRALAASGLLERVATHLLSSLFPRFDRADARVGDAWAEVRGEPFGLGVLSDRNYEIANVDEGVLMVSVSGDYRPAALRADDGEFPLPKEGAQAGGMAFRADVAGYEHGGYRLDLATGLPRRATLRQEVTVVGSMDGGAGGRGGMMMSMRIPVRVSGYDQIELRPWEQAPESVAAPVPSSPAPGAPAR